MQLDAGRLLVWCRRWQHLLELLLCRRLRLQLDGWRCQLRCERWKRVLEEVLCLRRLPESIPAVAKSPAESNSFSASIGCLLPEGE